MLGQRHRRWNNIKIRFYPWYCLLYHTDIYSRNIMAWTLQYAYFQSSNSNIRQIKKQVWGDIDVQLLPTFNHANENKFFFTRD